MPRTTRPSHETIADWLHRLGDIDPARVRSQPPLGKATEKDFLRLQDRANRLYELVDRTLVEKPMGAEESTLSCDLIVFLGTFVKQHKLGRIYGADGATRLMPGLVRVPDISFYTWARLSPTRKVPRQAVIDVAPNLAVEILSPSNTPAEMQRKLKEYFLAGVELVWIVDPRAWTIDVYTSPDARTTLGAAQTLDGGTVLPGFSVAVASLFEDMLPPAPAKKSRRRKSG